MIPTIDTSSLQRFVQAPRVIVTNKIKDFPPDHLAPFGIEAQIPDEFVLHLIDLAPGRVITVDRAPLRVVCGEPTHAVFALLTNRPRRWVPWWKHLWMHPLKRPEVVAAIELAVTTHLARPWSTLDFCDLDDRASHPCGIHSGDGFDVFVKFSSDDNGAVQFTLECSGLRYLKEWGAPTANTVGKGVLSTTHGTLLLLEGLTERAPKARTTFDWRSIGTVLGELHTVTADTFGLKDLDGYFGPIAQDNRPVATNQWADFLRERRIEPFLQEAIRSGQLPNEFVHRIATLADRLTMLVGPEPKPTLLHGDAQQNNYVSTNTGAVIVDASPFYGHPENDLAMIDVFEPVPNDVFDSYRDIQPIDHGFNDRRELWRIPVYLAIIAVDGGNPFGRAFINRLDEALKAYS